MSPRVIDKEAKKQQIVNAAIQVFARNGIVKTKMIDIADTAGIGKGTIYEYFRSKEEIFVTAFNHIYDGMADRIEVELASITDPALKLKLVIEESLRALFEEHKDFAGIMLEFWAEAIRNNDERTLQSIQLDNIYEHYRTILSQIINEGIQKGVFKTVDAFSTAAIIIAAMDGIMLQWILAPEVIDVYKSAEALMNLIMNGMQVNP
ncbi:MAG: TetR family transcriptional regulator [Caldithrix sp.]|nr:TetR family transcriptional regulator [Caldithrix sp.]